MNALSAPLGQNIHFLNDLPSDKTNQCHTACDKLEITHILTLPGKAMPFFILPSTTISEWHCEKQMCKEVHHFLGDRCAASRHTTLQFPNSISTCTGNL